MCSIDGRLLFFDAREKLSAVSLSFSAARLLISARCAAAISTLLYAALFGFPLTSLSIGFGFRFGFDAKLLVHLALLLGGCAALAFGIGDTLRLDLCQGWW